MCQNVLRDLTGAPAFDYSYKDEPDLFEKLLSYDGCNYMMCTGAEEKGTDEMKEMGLVGDHAYGLIGAKKVIDKDGNEARLVQLRNPWGKFEWKGAWNDNSDCWTPELKE